MRSSALGLAFVSALVAALPAGSAGAPYAEELFQAMQFRLVGPFRGGRSTAVAGVAQDPRTFYMGTTGGGVWKTTDAGLTWRNVTDKVREDKPLPAARPMGEGAAPMPTGSAAREPQVRAGQVGIIQPRCRIEIAAADVALGWHELTAEDIRVERCESSPVGRRDVDMPETDTLDGGHGRWLRRGGRDRRASA